MHILWRAVQHGGTCPQAWHVAEHAACRLPHSAFGCVSPEVCLQVATCACVACYAVLCMVTYPAVSCLLGWLLGMNPTLGWFLLLEFLWKGPMPSFLLAMSCATCLAS